MFTVDVTLYKAYKAHTKIKETTFSHRSALWNLIIAGKMVL